MLDDTTGYEIRKCTINLPDATLCLCLEAEERKDLAAREADR